MIPADAEGKNCRPIPIASARADVLADARAPGKSAGEEMPHLDNNASISSNCSPETEGVAVDVFMQAGTLAGAENPIPAHNMKTSVQLAQPHEEKTSPSGNFSNEAGLPANYGRTCLILMEVEPLMVHAYWEITLEDRERPLKEFSHEDQAPVWVLRFYDKTKLDFDRENADSCFDIPVDLAPGNWYVKLWEEEKSYFAEIGPQGANGRFIPVCCSNVVHLPRTNPSPRYEPRWLYPDADAGTKVAVAKNDQPESTEDPNISEYADEAPQAPAALQFREENSVAEFYEVRSKSESRKIFERPLSDGIDFNDETPTRDTGPVAGSEQPFEEAQPGFREAPSQIAIRRYYHQLALQSRPAKSSAPLKEVASSIGKTPIGGGQPLNPSSYGILSPSLGSGGCVFPSERTSLAGFGRPIEAMISKASRPSECYENRGASPVTENPGGLRSDDSILSPESGQDMASESPGTEFSAPGAASNRE
jgi:hypothetical protein